MLLRSRCAALLPDLVKQQTCMLYGVLDKHGDGDGAVPSRDLLRGILGRSNDFKYTYPVQSAFLTTEP